MSRISAPFVHEWRLLSLYMIAGGDRVIRVADHAWGEASWEEIMQVRRGKRSRRRSRARAEERQRATISLQMF